MTENESAIFRAEMFERASRAILGLPVDPPALAAKAAGDAAAPPPAEREAEAEEDDDDGR